MPRAVPVDTARRRRDRLAELIDALGAARGQRVTQREFAASIGREQGTVAAILGGDRSLGADVMMAVVQAYRLPSDYFDRALRPDPRPFARAAVGQPDAGQAITASASAINGDGQAIPGIASAVGARPAGDVGLGEALAALSPDRSVTMALEALFRRGLRADGLGWERLVIGAQSAHDHGVLLDWFDETLAAHMATSPAADERAEEAPVREVRGRLRPR